MSAQINNVYNHSNMLVYASELAAAIGRNKYKQPWVVFENMWRRLNEQQYEECVAACAGVECSFVKEAEEKAAALIHSAAELVDARSTTATVETVAAGAVAAVQQVVQVQLEQVWQGEAQREVVEQLQVCKTPGEVQAVLHNVADVKQEQVEATVKLVQKRVELESKAVSEVQCTFGTVREAHAREQVQRSGQAREIRHDNKFHVAWMEEPLPVSRGRWGIGGRLDGLDADGRVVEIKNRARHFFAKVPDYEYVQVQAYMHMMNAASTLFVQQLNGQQRTCLIHRCTHEWSDVIVPALTKFVHLLDLLLDDESYLMRAEWVRCTEADKQRLLEQWLQDDDMAQERNAASTW